MNIFIIIPYKNSNLNIINKNMNMCMNINKEANIMIIYMKIRT